MSDIWTKALRGGPATTTPRTKSYSNNRYGSKGADDMEDSADSGLKRTPRQASMYEKPWKDLASIPSAGRGTPRSRSYAARPPIPRTNSAMDDGDTASIAESDDISVATEDDFRDGGQEGESVQVFVRVRPINGAEAAEGEHYNCTRLYGDRTVSVELKHRAEPYQFKFDCVLPENTTQQEIFDRAGKPIVDNCMAGYNSTIFAYGQTGAGKTYTMQGPMAAALSDESDERGLAPRVFEYLFSEIDKAQDESCHGNLTFCCRCSMLEIYNEVITDLLNPSATNLQIREDIKRGCYVEDLSEQLIQNVSDAMRLMRTGAENRHVGETRLNRESSRSHSVFACTLERHSKSEETGVTNVLFSRLNLIDLAGSERIHGGEHGGSQATGKHFKEACHINKSLTTLGRVIMELVEAQRTGGGRGSSAGGGSKGLSGSKTRHVPYRDSRLTFLLQDSLGGNAKTLMIANISPSSVSAQETLSTLQFMSRAKCIRNRATINLDARGDVVLLQREIVRLNNELDNLRKGYTEPAIQENKQLRIKLEEMCGAKGQMEALMMGLEKENQNLKAERRRLDHKMSQIQKGAGQLDQAIFSLTAKVMHHESLAAAATERSLAAAKAEHELQLAEMQLALDEQAMEAEQLQGVVADLQVALQQERSVREGTELRLQSELRDSVAAAAEKVQLMQKELQNVHATVQDLKSENDQLREQLAVSKDEGSQEAQKHAAEAAATKEALQQQAAEAEAAQQALQQQLNEAADSMAALQRDLQESHAANASLQEQLAATTAEGTVLKQQLEDAEANSSGLRQQLAEATAGGADLQQQLAAMVESRDEAKQALQMLQDVNAGLDEQVKQLLKQTEQMGSKLMDKDEVLSSTSQELAEVQQKLQSVQEELAEAQEQLASHQREAAAQASSNETDRQQMQEQLRQTHLELEQATEQLEEARQQISNLASTAADLKQQVQELQARNSSACSDNEHQQQQIEHLKQQLQDAEAASVADKATYEAQVQELQQQLKAEQGQVAESSTQVAALEEALSELNALVKEKTQALECSQEQCKQLQHQLEASTAAATAKAEQLSHDLAAARESSKSRQEELMKQVTEVHLQLSAAQQEQERLQDELDAARSDYSLLKAQQAENEAQIDKLRGQASSKALDCDLLRKKLSAAEACMSSLKAELSERDEELDELKIELQKAEAATHEQQEKAAEQLNSLQRELMDSQELLDSKTFEVTQMQRRLEELAHRLTDRNGALDAQKQEVKCLKSTVAKMDALARERDALLAEKSELVDRLQAENEQLNSRLHKLQEDLASKETQLRCKLNANELQLKEQIVYNARNRQAMNEIRKVINWAQQAPLPQVSTPTHSQHHSRSKERQQQPYSPTVLASEENFTDDGFGALPGSSTYAGSHSSSGGASHAGSSSSGGSSAGSGRSRGGSSGAGQLAPGLPGPPGSECLPLMLEEVEIDMSATGMLGAKRFSDGTGSCGGTPAGDGDGHVAVTLGSSGGSRGSKSKKSSKKRLPEVDVSCTERATHEAQEGSHKETHQLFGDDSRADIGNDCPRSLLVPEQTSSPVRLSADDSLGSPQQRSRTSMSKNSRRADKDTARRLRMGSDHHNFSGNKKHNVLMSTDGNVVLSVSAEWAAGGHEHQQPDMRLPAAIIGDCDCEQDT